MNLKTMLARFESALGYHNLAEEMVLLSEPKTPISSKGKSAKSVNFIVGYNSSPNSQIALDIALWIAHQTRLVTTEEVTVQVVYVLDKTQDNYCQYLCNFAEENLLVGEQKLSNSKTTSSALNCAAPAIALPAATIESISSQTAWIDPLYLQTIFCQNNQYEIADRLLWQARCLAEEWRGLFKAHLRIGLVATELRNVVELESANVLFLGCNSVNDPLVRALGNNFPCCVLGIPSTLTYQMDLQPEYNSSKLELSTTLPRV